MIKITPKSLRRLQSENLEINNQELKMVKFESVVIVNNNLIAISE